MDDKIIKFTPKQRIFEIKFTTPPVIKLKKTAECDIQLELQKYPQDNMGTGVAYVPARSQTHAIDKLSELLNVYRYEVIGEV